MALAALVEAALVTAEALQFLVALELLDREMLVDMVVTLDQLVVVAVVVLAALVVLRQTILEETEEPGHLGMTVYLALVAAAAALDIPAVAVLLGRHHLVAALVAEAEAQHLERPIQVEAVADAEAALAQHLVPVGRVLL